MATLMRGLVRNDMRSVLRSSIELVTSWCASMATSFKKIIVRRCGARANIVRHGGVHGVRKVCFFDPLPAGLCG
jgi:hypothetical protein